MVQVTQGDCVHDHVFINVRGGGSGGEVGEDRPAFFWGP